MTDEYQNAVHKLMDYLDQTVIFAKGELPDIANQILIYGASVSHFWLLLIGTFAAFSFVLWVFYMLVADEDHIPGKIIVGLLVLGLTSVAGSIYANLVMIEKAPKLYIMEEMGRHLKAAQCSSK